MSHPYEAFQAALEKLINDSKRGTQTDLRKFLKTTPSYMNGVIKGRFKFGLDRQVKCAEFFGLSYTDMIMLGESILSGEADVMPWQSGAKQFKQNSIERASFIINKVAESQGWKNFMFFSAPSIKQWGHEAITKYLNADLTDNDLYVEEVASCLAGVAVAPCNCHKKSRNFLRKIIFKQRIDPQALTIDGLNELTAEQRQTISQFRSNLFAKNFEVCRSYHQCPPNFCLKCEFGKAFFKI